MYTAIYNKMYTTYVTQLFTIQMYKTYVTQLSTIQMYTAIYNTICVQHNVTQLSTIQMYTT